MVEAEGPMRGDGSDVEKTRGEGIEEDDAIEDEWRMADIEGVARKTFDDEGAAADGGPRAERLRETDGFVRSITEETGAALDEVAGTFNDKRGVGGFGEGLAVGVRTNAAPGSAGMAATTGCTPRTPSVHGLRRITQL
jgi:hypothetical protein